MTVMTASSKIAEHAAELLSLQRKIAVVTGAGSGIGRGICLRLAEMGACVAALDIDEKKARETASQIGPAGAGRATVELTAKAAKGSRRSQRTSVSGPHAMAIKCDVRVALECHQAVASIIEKWDRVDILCNCAGIAIRKDVVDLSEEEWDRVLAVTLKSQFLMGKHVAAQMVAQGTGGRIVNIGSTSGFMGRSRAIAYSAAKGGVANLTRAMAAQLAPHRIRVNGIVPNKIGSPVGKDEFDPTRPVPNMAKRPGEPKEAAKAVLFLVSDDSSFVYGANLFVDGGVSAMDLS